MSHEQTVATYKTTKDAHVEGIMNDDVKYCDSSSKRGRYDVDPFEPNVNFERQTHCFCSHAALNNLYGYIMCSPKAH